MCKLTSRTQLAAFLFVDSRWHEPHDAVQCRDNGLTLEFLFEFQTEFFSNILFIIIIIIIIFIFHLSIFGYIPRDVEIVKCNHIRKTESVVQYNRVTTIQSTEQWIRVYNHFGNSRYCLKI